MIEYTNQELLFLAVGALGLGLYLLLKGGSWTIDSAIYLASRIGVSPLVIGFTVVAFGTSLPELFVSVTANIEGSPGIAVGNVVGSNTANILFILGVTAIVTSLTVRPQELLRDLLVMLGASALLMALLIFGGVGRVAGGLMIAALCAYVFWQYLMARKGKTAGEDIEIPASRSLPAMLGILFAGLASIALGAEFLVRGAKVSATIIGVPEDVIGLSIIALGTSLPELSTCIIAALKKQSDIVIGNIVGSNVFNILAILGIAAVVKPLPREAIAQQIISLDMWVMFMTALGLSLLLLLMRGINRPLGIVFVTGYVLYIAVMYGLYLGTDV